MGGRIVAERFEEMKRGQAERLFPALEEVLGEAGAVWQDLDAIGVGVGPGNFTGVRISVAAARGLALSLGVPAVAVTGFETVRASLRIEEGTHLTILPAPRDQLYWQITRSGIASSETGLSHRSEFAPHSDVEGPAVIGPVPDTAPNVYPLGSIRVHLDLPVSKVRGHDRAIAPAIAQETARRFGEGGPFRPPAPLYIRPADAAPPREAPPRALP